MLSTRFSWSADSTRLAFEQSPLSNHQRSKTSAAAIDRGLLMRRLVLNLATSVSACLYEAMFVSLLIPKQVAARRSFFCFWLEPLHSRLPLPFANACLCSSFFCRGCTLMRQLSNNWTDILNLPHHPFRYLIDVSISQQLTNAAHRK